MGSPSGSGREEVRAGVALGLEQYAVDPNSTALPTTGGGTTEDPAARGAFQRLRTAETGNRLDVEFSYDKQRDLFDEITNNGTVTFNTNTRDLTLSVSDASDGTLAKMSSHPVPYTPGNGNLILLTGVLNLANIAGGTIEVFLRSSITGTASVQAVEQSAWDADYQDGIDWTTSQIFVMDFQSLRVGKIRFGLDIGGEIKYVTSITNDNIRDSGYWQIPSLPVYYKIFHESDPTPPNTVRTYLEIGYGDEANGIGFRYRLDTANASATMKAICCTVKSEAGVNLQDIPGLSRSADNGTTTRSVSGTLFPILSIRPKSIFNSLPNLGVNLPKSYSVQTSQDIRIVVIYNGTLTGASWNDVNSLNSSMEYDVSATAITGTGVIVDTLYQAASGGNFGTGPQTTLGLLGKTVLWNRQIGLETGILTIAAQITGGSNANCLATLKWDEIR